MSAPSLPPRPAHTGGAQTRAHPEAPAQHMRMHTSVVQPTQQHQHHHPPNRPAPASNAMSAHPCDPPNSQTKLGKHIKNIRDPASLPQTEVDTRLKSLRRRARFLDSQFSCCCGLFRFGVEAVIGLIPVIGDFAGVFLALTYMNTIRRKFDVPPSLVSQMMFNIAIDFVVGLVPLLGDIVDMMFKANMRNYRLVEEHVQSSRTAVSMRGLEEGGGGIQQPGSRYIPKVPLKNDIIHTLVHKQQQQQQQQQHSTR